VGTGDQQGHDSGSDAAHEAAEEESGFGELHRLIFNDVIHGNVSRAGFS
jgi:hypothetical protein